MAKKKRSASFQPDPPFCVQVEFTEGCNFYCDFCGLRGIREKAGGPYKYLTPKIAEKIARDIADAGWRSRIEFAMHGEPTMHPERARLVRIFREALPRNQLMMTSNGGGIVGKPGPAANLEELFEAGLNVFALDNYVSYGIGEKIRTRLREAGGFSGKLSFDIRDYPKDITASPHARRPRGTRLMVIVEDISQATKGNHATLNNHCGSGAPLDFSAAGQRCAKPFREITTRWDGRVAFCCNDWRGVLEAGDVRKESLREIWEGRVYSVARKFLYHGMREFSPCLGCNARSYRVGLLPDQRGRKTLPKPTAEDRRFIEGEVARLKRRPMAKPVVRDWEKKK